MARGLVLLMLVAAAALGALAARRGDEDAAPLFEGGRAPLWLGPVPEAADCAGCHAAIAEEWAGSLHAASWTDPVFQAAYAVEPLAFCRNCHAPLNTGAEPEAAAAHDGISCAVCHVRDGEVLGRGHGPPAPHGVRIEPALGEPRFCAPCHEFGFLGERDGVFTEGRELQQATVHEHAQSGTSRTCQGCHMPLVDGHRSHRFAASRDPALLARSLDLAVDARRVAYNTVAVDVHLAPGDVGHAVPTGDLNRRLELYLWVGEQRPRLPQLGYQRIYGERVEPDVGRVMFVRGDTRVGVGPDVRTHELAAGAGATIHWRLDYLLMSRETAAVLGVDPALNVTTLARGDLVVP